MTNLHSEPVRRLRKEDIPAAFRLSAQAGWNQTEDDWRRLLELAPQGCLAIDMDGHLAATATLLSYGRRLAWIGMVLTSSEYRRRGLAKTLMSQALLHADEMGIETIKLDATDEGKPLYESLGFHGEQEIERWSRPGDDAAPLSNVSISEREVWRELDSPAFGADRSPLLETLAQLNPPAFLPQSYLFTRAGRFAAYLGPCVSESAETARRLIAPCVRDNRRAWCWDLFSRNREATALARDLGFTPKRQLVRMARGKELRENENAIYAIAGLELG